MLLEELIEGFDVEVQPRSARSVRACAVHGPRADEPVRICDITEDSRTVMPGSLFIARRGEKSDGAAYIGDAIAAGACAILAERATPIPEAALPQGVLLLRTGDARLVSAQMAERFYGNPTSHLTLIGVTGTNGKSTIAHLVHQMLNGARRRCGLIGTVQIDDGVEVAPASLTTPPALELSHAFSRMVEAGCVAAVMETSSHALHQHRVAALNYRIAVFTNLTGDHLDYHGTMEHYARAKAMLFEMLPESGDGGACAIANCDDPRGEFMAGFSKAPVLRCAASRRPGIDCWAEVGARSLDGMEIRLNGPWGVITGTLPLVGEHNVMNALQAVAAAHAAGVDAATIQRLLPRLKAPPGRLEPVRAPGGAAAGFHVFVDYAHTDDALANAIGALRPLLPAGGKLRVVFGCGGDRDRTKRPRMGKVVSERADAVYVTSDNPRTENPSRIIREIIEGIDETRRAGVHVDAERERAIHRAIDEAREGDIVLIAGKGHEDYQILPDGSGGTIRRHFDDREVARAALNARAPVQRSTA